MSERAESRRGDVTTEPMAPAQYEPPRVERVLSPVELEREILYAGEATQFDDVQA